MVILGPTKDGPQTKFCYNHSREQPRKASACGNQVAAFLFWGLAFWRCCAAKIMAKSVETRSPCKSFRINTCKSVSKQRTLTVFRMNTCEKPGEGGIR